MRHFERKCKKKLKLFHPYGMDFPLITIVKANLNEKDSFQKKQSVLYKINCTLDSN